MPIGGQLLPGPASGEWQRAREVRDAILVQAAATLLASPRANELNITDIGRAAHMVAELWKRIQAES
jgi:hypothetical protein